MDLKSLITSLCGLYSVSGAESASTQGLDRILGDLFDEHITYGVGNHVFIKRCGRKNAPKILLDAHFDEIGMLVCDISDEGFVRMTNVGGVDTRILPGAKLLIYGKQVVEGIVCAMPTRLLGNDPEALPEIGQLYIDTGFGAHELKKMISIGSPIGFMPTYTTLLGDRLAGKAFDDKACGACIAHGVAAVKAEDLAGDVYFLFSAGEETSMMGAMTGGAALMPDFAMVIDVTHAATPETGELGLAPFGSGAVLEYAPVTNRALTNMTKRLITERGIPFTCSATGGSTGTNANRLWMTGDGVPTVLVSLPIKNMHSSTEVLDLRDAQAVADVVSAFVCDKQIAEDFAR
ncbi:MAG: M20/M25/M40 family metallo-hydrolase [Clostridia bacterium]|jgi:endoglucanase|nr:M20/M25/M40 family metallo-hydrolase [Clostridia bacterium]